MKTWQVTEAINFPDDYDETKIGDIVTKALAGAKIETESVVVLGEIPRNDYSKWDESEGQRG
jgi:hypothetical protein